MPVERKIKDAWLLFVFTYLFLITQKLFWLIGSIYLVFNNYSTSSPMDDNITSPILIDLLRSDTSIRKIRIIGQSSFPIEVRPPFLQTKEF